ncbi:hypothetical protein FKM82_011177, partial [Ascaphus truei]
VSDLVIILNHKRAVEAFAKGGNLTLGGNFTVAIGPLGRFYCQEDIRAYEILFGEVPRPDQAEGLYEILDFFTEKYQNEEHRYNMRKLSKEQKKAKETSSKPQRPRSHPPTSEAPAVRSAPKFHPDVANYNIPGKSSRGDGIIATALYPFEGQQPGDLMFQAGDKITVTTKTDLQFDWWEGRLKGNTGIFPANYVSLN